MMGVKAPQRHDVMTSQRRGARRSQEDRGLFVAFIALLWGLGVAGYQLLIAVCRTLGWLAWIVAEGLDMANEAMARSTADRSHRVMRTGPRLTYTTVVVPAEQEGAAA
jgi:hypothetical protein